MAVIDSAFRLDAHVIYKWKTISVVTLEWSEIKGMHNFSGTLVRDRRPEQVMK